MIKKALIHIPLFFVVLILYEWVFRNEIHWKDNLGIAVLVFLVYEFINWAMKPYDYKKKKK